jgi:hypothetical protein
MIIKTTTKKPSRIKARAKEPSTHAGIAAGLQAAAFFFPQYAAIFHAATVAFGTIATFLPDGLNQ